MENRAIQSVAIIGGGLAGWMSAALLANVFGPSINLTLVETGQEGEPGHAQTTLPLIKSFFQRLGIGETELLAKTQGTLKLGTQFVNWGSLGNRYFSPFGSYGADFDIVPLHHYWLQQKAVDSALASLDDFSMAWALARENRFTPPSPDRRLVQSTFDYGYHLDSGLLINVLKAYATGLGVVGTQGGVAGTAVNPQTGHIESVQLDSGETIAADFFLDCSGLNSVLLQGALGVERLDWSDGLPANQITSLACARGGEFAPITRATQRSAGWQGKMPLQDRTAHIHVYCDAFTTPDEALSVLMDNLDGPLVAEPQSQTVRAGKARKTMHKNVVAIGDASGYLEPLAGTSLHLIQSSLYRLISAWPRPDFDAANAQIFNDLIQSEWETVRDLLALHYRLTSRTDSHFWRQCAGAAMSDGLQARVKLWAATARIAGPIGSVDVFQPSAWLSAFVGQGLLPHAWDPVADARAAQVQPQARLSGLFDVIGQTAAQATPYPDWLAANALAPKRTH